ncbi:hypothetical protein [Chitinophaga filiformis]|uniref:Uncharacterized protein n=1 Tax=Chitinophaga filiformis TaxID=104663 RepID=A0A1G7P4I5_CHIFI|nr:hypothetical protein [Chitinophaga filiformis]SDF81017.1 hypothetical protein SAMN04488121_1021054 [Chitinophaga filiformis]
MIINISTPYPVFKKGQQLKSSSLTGIVTFAGQEDQDTRTYLEGSGIFYGLDVVVDEAAGTVRLRPGTAVTSDGQLFSLEDEIIYNGIGKTSEGKDFDVPLLDRTATVMVLSNTNENHNELIYRLSGNDPGNPEREPDTTPYLVILIVRSDESTEDSCLYGYENSESKKTLEVEAALIPKSFFTQAELDAWFINDATEAGDKDPVINRFGYTASEGGPHISFEPFTSWAAVSTGFDDVCKAAEPLIGTAFKSVYELVKEKLGLDPVNPFDSLTENLQKLREGVGARGGRQYPWLYDYYRDLVATYQELVATDLFSYLSLMPKKSRFRGYIALHSIRTMSLSGQEKINYRMGLYRPPFADLGIDALDRPRLLIQRLKYLADVSHTRFDDQNFPSFGVRFTPDAGINKLLSERAIPFYYKNPSELSAYWNAAATRNRRTFNIPGITDDKDRKFLLANMDGYDFFRIKGHTGETVQITQDAIADLRRDLHLPFDIKVVYLGDDEDMDQLIRERSAEFSDLTVILEKIVNDIRCARTCSDNFEEVIFGREFDRNAIGDMFEALVTLFGKPPVDLEKKIAEICSKEGTCNDDDKTCCRAHLTSLYAVCEEYVRRKGELTSSLLFHRFAEEHPGLEHNGGVPKGGTLVLVCAKTNVASLSEAEKSKLVNLMLSSKEEEKAAAMSLAKELEGYEVVADFCLPYICCSSKPAINLILRESPPVARFSIIKQEEMPEGQGVAISLRNQSLRADAYHWELYDYKGVFITDKDTTSLNDVVEFELERKRGVVFTVVLTASREGMESQFSKEITICPLKDVKLTSNGKVTVDWDISRTDEIGIEATPYGGAFSLILQQNDNQEPIDPLNFDVTWKEDKKHATLKLEDPQVGIYFLDYTFEDVQDCKESFARLTISAFVPASKESAPDTGTTADPNANARSIVNSDAVFNKRILGYRSDVNKMAKEDETLSEDSRWTDTKSFLLASGAPEVLHAGYEKLQATLQTGFTKLKAAQKVQVIKLLVYATAYYIDRLIVESPEKVPAIARKLVKAAADSITAQKDGLAQWQQVWNTTGIVTAENEKTVNTYKGIVA